MSSRERRCPASSACFGYMLVAVKPGSVFISLM